MQRLNKRKTNVWNEEAENIRANGRDKKKRGWERVADCRDTTLITLGLDKKGASEKKRIKEKNEVGLG